MHNPMPRLTRRRTDVDVLNETWATSSDHAFLEGSAHPTRPGMIVDEAVYTEEIPGESYTCELTCLGAADGDRPTKVVGHSEAETLEPGWDEFDIEYLTYNAHWRACTAVASTEVITCASHGFANGQKVVFRNLVGGASLVPASATSHGTIYFVIDSTALTFKVSATLGGSAFNITSDMSAGFVCAAEFVKGQAHPDFANMYAVEVKKKDANVGWQNVTVGFRGMMAAKPYNRVITCNGQTLSTGEPITVGFTDGWGTPHYSQAQIPKVVCTDTYLTTDTPATNQIPYSQGEGATPPDPPSIRTLVVTGSEERLVYQWPNGWSRLAEETVGSIPLRSVNLKKRVTEYVWPILLR